MHVTMFGILTWSLFLTVVYQAYQSTIEKTLTKNATSFKPVQSCTTPQLNAFDMLTSVSLHDGNCIYIHSDRVNCEIIRNDLTVTEHGFIQSNSIFSSSYFTDILLLVIIAKSNGILQLSQMTALFTFHMYHANAEWVDVTSPEIPIGDYRRAIGYDSHNHLVWLIGGSNERTQLISFNPLNNSFTDYGQVLDMGLRSLSSHSYTQKHNTLYIAYGYYLYEYHLDNIELNVQQLDDERIPHGTKHAAELSCLSNVDNYILFTLGRSLQIYNLTNSSWISTNMPPMINYRVLHGCQTSTAQYLYVFGGSNSYELIFNSIEVLYVGDIENIVNYSWVELQDTLSVARANAPSVIFKDLIYYISGDTKEDGVLGRLQPAVDVIDTKTNSVSLIEPLSEAIKLSAAVMISGRIYVFGGRDNSDRDITYYQYNQLVTDEPTSDPSAAPSMQPSNAPTTPPTQSPTRYPTHDIRTLYDTFIQVEYTIKYLNSGNKRDVVKNTYENCQEMQEILERNYFDENVLQFRNFYVKITQINGIIVDGNSGRLLTEYDLDINNIERKPMIISTRIECKQQMSGFIITRTGTGTFITETQKQLGEMFNNSDILFDVSTPQSELNAQNKYPTKINEDKTAIIVSISMLAIGTLISFAAFMFNIVPFTKVDNTAFYVPLMLSLTVYDFLSDINLSITIFKNENTQISINNITFLLAVLSVIFIILPFASNLYYAMRINSMKTIKECPSARAWFSKHLAPFILLCVLCAGTFPVLGLTSSRLFGFDFFNAGLLSSDLHELSKIKIRSTIFCENIPQLLVQIAYSYIIGKLETATILAFTASSLSIIASVVIYKAQKVQNGNIIMTKYFIRLYTENNVVIDSENHTKIKSRKGFKKRLGDVLCNVFNVSNKCIEIGYITANDYGCVIHIQHSIFENDLNVLKNKLLSQDQTMLNQGYKIDITEDMYVANIFELKRTQILNALLQHFDLENKDREFNVSYHKQYTNNFDDDDLNTTDIVQIANNIRRQTKTQKRMYHQIETNMNEGDDAKNDELEMIEINYSYGKQITDILYSMQKQINSQTQLLAKFMSSHNIMDENDILEDLQRIEDNKSTQL